MKTSRAWLILSLLLVTVSARAVTINDRAVTTNDLATAQREGRELAEKLRNAKPAENFTNSGTVLIRASRKQRTLQFTSRVVVTETNWTSFYQATGDTNIFSNFSVEHRPDAPSVYRLNETNVLNANQTTQPFAGSDFWLSDLGLEFLHWPVQLLTHREVKRSNACSVLESRNPSPAPGGYSQIVSWVDIDTGGILLAKAYDAKGRFLKEFQPEDFQKVDGEYQLKKMVIKNAQTGSSTSLTFDLKSP